METFFSLIVLACTFWGIADPLPRCTAKTEQQIFVNSHYVSELRSHSYLLTQGEATPAKLGCLLTLAGTETFYLDKRPCSELTTEKK